MATTNPIITSDWSLIVTAGDEFILSCRQAGPIEIAIRDAVTAPVGIAGHVIDPYSNEGVDRATVGPGYVYARRADSGDAVAVVLTAWTP